MNYPKSCKFKLFVEGVWIPDAFWSARITSTVNGCARAEISLTPVGEARFVLERTLVHVFWEHDGAYRLIFEGEVVADRFVKKTKERAHVLVCEDFSSHWKQAYRLFFDITYQDPMPDRKVLNINAYKGITESGAQKPHTNFLHSAFGDGKGATVSLPQGIYNLLKMMVVTNDFFSLADQRLNLVDRAYVVQNAFSHEIMKRFILAPEAKVNMQLGPLANLHQILMQLMSQIYYQFVPIASPHHITARDDGDPFSTGAPAQFLFLPELDFTAPPRCNVLFPEHYGEFEITRDFMAAPTRTQVTAAMNEGGSIDRWYAPEEIQDIYSDKSGEQSVVLPEEMLKGIVLHQATFDSRETIFAGAEIEALRKDYASIVNYIHHRKRFSSRSINSVVGRFNPFLVCGLPALILDSDWGGFIGSLTSVTHTLDGRGSAHTTASMARIRIPVTDEKPDYVPDWAWDRETQAPKGFYDPEGKLAAAGKPFWFESSLDPSNIGEFYEKALGHTQDQGSIMTYGAETPYESVSEAVEGLRDNYFSMAQNTPEARQDWALRYVSRDIATEFEVFTALGASPRLNEEEFDEFNELPDDEMRLKGFPEYIGASENVGVDIADVVVSGPFIIERQAWARALRRKLAEKHVHYKN